MENEYWICVLVLGLLAIGASVWLIQNVPKQTPEFHLHADFAVFINGNHVDFAKEQFMSTEQQTQSERVHLHDLDGNVIHIHATGVTLKEFFESLEMQFSDTCFELDTNETHCSSASQTLKFFVNGQQRTEMQNYEPKDLDRILISFGSENQIQINEQLDAVSDNACIFSEKCPERGPAPPESCTPGKCQE